MKRIISMLLFAVMLISTTVGMSINARANDLTIKSLDFGKSYTESFSKDDFYIEDSNVYADYYTFTVPADGTFTLTVKAGNKDYYSIYKTIYSIADVNDNENQWIYSESETFPGKVSEKISKGEYLLMFIYQDTSLKGNFTFSLDYKPTVKKTSVSKLTAAKKAFTAKWKKASGSTGYQLQYSTDKSFKKNVKTVNVKKAATIKKTVKKLKAKKKYYVRIRAYKTVKYNGKNKNFYSKWSAVKNVKTK